MGGTPVVLVNGPCRHTAEINFKLGVCGSGHRSHTVGRALRLLLQNVGRARLGGTESTTIGNPMKFGLCFGEWEERGSMWEPLSVQHGFDRDADAVTVAGGHGRSHWGKCGRWASITASRYPRTRRYEEPFQRMCQI